MDDQTAGTVGLVEVRKPGVTIFVTRSRGQWVIRDPNGNYWVVPSVEDPWEHREQYDPVDGTDLEPVPGHYRYLFKLPF